MNKRLKVNLQLKDERSFIEIEKFWSHISLISFMSMASKNNTFALLFFSAFAILYVYFLSKNLYLELVINL